MNENHFLHLTDIGREVAETIYERHCFFTEQLIAAGVDPKIAEADACRGKKKTVAGQIAFCAHSAFLKTAAVLKYIQGRRSFMPS